MSRPSYTGDICRNISIISINHKRTNIRLHLPNLPKFLLRILRLHTRRHNDIIARSVSPLAHSLFYQSNRNTYIQSIGVVTPFLSPSCKLSTTLSTSFVFLPTLAGYIIVSLIFFAGSITKTLRIVNAMPFSSILARSWESTMS